MSHTPGPWKVIGRHITANHEGEADIAVAKVELFFGSEAAEANARLIAAAPEQREALTVARNALHRAWVHLHPGTIADDIAAARDAVDAALDKAEHGVPSPGPEDDPEPGRGTEVPGEPARGASGKAVSA